MVLLKGMWEQALSPSNGGSSMRRIFSFVMAVIISVFFWTTLFSPNSQAASNTATWQGDSILYQGNQYIDNGTSQDQNGLTIPKGSDYYSYAPTPASSNSQAVLDVIYFAKGQNTTTATSATYVAYDMSNTQPAQFSNPHDQTTVTIDNSNNGKSNSTSCAVTGIGWIICSLGTSIAGGMDYLYNTALVPLITVHPLSTSTSSTNSLYVAWSTMRSIANVAFIIAFLLIIFSQLTSFGIDNYGLKKILPRLIVAAILVNLSYYLCAIFVDLSNILGVGIQNLLEALRPHTAQVSWAGMTQFILSGGTAGLAGVAGGIGIITATGGSITSLIFLLLPAMLGLLLSLLVTFLIIAARQALIIILVVISPLAFVAYLLPNTEQWFKKWRSMFTTMMVFFPAFSVVFGGAQLAGGLIIANATSIVTMMLGMIVQLAPLAITPWLLRFSGSTIQGVVKRAQDINKRMVGATSNWAKPRQESFKQRAIGSDLKRFNVMRRLGRWNNYRQEAVKHRTEAGKSNFEAYANQRISSTKAGQKRIIQQARGKARSEIIQGMRTKALADLEAGSTEGFRQMQAMKSSKPIDAYYDANGVLTPEVRFKINQDKMILPDEFAAESLTASIKNAQRKSIIDQATHNAKHVSEANFAHAMRTNKEMQKQAGGVHTHKDAGSHIALAGAINTIHKAEHENLSAAEAVFNSYQFDGAQATNLALYGRARNAKGEELDGELFQQYAINNLTKLGLASSISQMVLNTKNYDEDIRSTLKTALDTNHPKVKEVAFWATDDSIKQKIVLGQDITETDIDDVIQAQFAGGKVTGEQFSTQDIDTLLKIRRGVESGKIHGKAIENLAEIARDLARDQPTLTKMKKVALDQLIELSKILHDHPDAESVSWKDTIATDNREESPADLDPTNPDNYKDEK